MTQFVKEVVSTPMTSDYRGSLVQAAHDTSIALSQQQLLQKELAKKTRTKVSSAAKLSELLKKSRAETTKIEIEMEKLRRDCEADEDRCEEAREQTARCYYKFISSINGVKTTGTESDKAAIEALFERPVRKDNDAPFCMPQEHFCFKVTHLLHETYHIVSNLENLQIPETAIFEARDVLLFPEGQEEQNQRGRLKLARVFRRVSKADVFQFVMSNTSLAEQGKAASVFATISDGGTINYEEFDKVSLVCTCWFGLYDSDICPFPSSRGDTFKMSIQGTDHGRCTRIFSNSEPTQHSPEILSALFRMANEFGITCATSRDKLVPAKLEIVVDWSQPYWRRKLPLEYAQCEQVPHDSCRIICIPLAVRVKRGLAAEYLSDFPEVPIVFSVLCLHESSRQLFWHQFDQNNVSALKLPKKSEVQCEIGNCSCVSSFTSRVSRSSQQISADRLTPNSSLDQLKRAGKIDEESLKYFAMLETIMHNTSTDPSVLLEAAKESTKPQRYVADLFPQDGYTVVVNSTSSRKRSTSEQTDDLCEAVSFALQKNQPLSKKPTAVISENIMLTPPVQKKPRKQAAPKKKSTLVESK